MSILVFENEIELKKNDIIKSGNIICPECKENIKMDIINYKINIYECKNKHKMENILLDEFEETQNIDRLNILCDICQKNNKSISYNNIFYKCLTCGNNICPLCKSNHDNTHNIINYDDKYYICSEHNENYVSYCEECKINLCTLCEGHKKHKRKLFADYLPKNEELIRKKDTLQYYIHNFNNVINSIISVLNDVKNKVNIYYKINEDIINNYNNKNRNYEIIYNLNQFQNNKIIDELNNIIECNNIIDKFTYIFNMYRKMNIDEINIKYKVDNLKEIKLFGEDFVKRNKKNCSLIINGKEQVLNKKYSFGMFDSKKNILEIKLKGITNITNMNGMFSKCISLLSLPNIFKWNTSNITDISYLFFGCNSLLSLPDISKWNTSNVTNMSFIFRDCKSLISLPDISEWDTSNVTNMSDIFCHCNSLLSLPNISKWKISNVTNTSFMFSNCYLLASLPDISEWDTSNVTNMSDMFSYCSALLSLPDISRWNMLSATNISGMFYGCKSLKFLPDISKWNISNVKYMNDIFTKCDKSLNIPNKFLKNNLS